MSHSDSPNIVIKGATICDGSGSPLFKADIAITGDTITSIGADIPSADLTLDASGLVVCPGFIDTHTHSEFTLLADPRAEGKIAQGVTSEISGNCGLSAAPLLSAAKERREADQREYGITSRWETFEEYFHLLESVRPAINYATLVGHGNIRASVMGYADRLPTDDEAAHMRKLMKDAVGAGAIGMSTGLIYPPGVYSHTAEIAELARVGLTQAKAQGSPFIYTSHMRSEGERLLESIEETIEIGRLSGTRVHISHLKTGGKANWHKAAAAIALMDNARSAGMILTCDRYPYIASATDLDAVLPPWMFEGGTEAQLNRLNDDSILDELRKLSESWPDGWDAIRVSDVGGQTNKWVEGKSMPEIAARWKMEPFDAMVRLLREERLRVGAIFGSMSEDNLHTFLSLPYCMVGSDSSARCFNGVTRRGKPHPRTYGSMPRFLRMAIDGKLGRSGNADEILPHAIKKLTSVAAATFGIKDRGLLRVGMKADITVLDPASIRDRADFDDPFVRPDGIVHVLVNGQVSLKDGEIKPARGGKVLTG